MRSLCIYLYQKVQQSLEFPVSPMPPRRYVEENFSAAMMATKRLVGVTPEVNLRECVTYTPQPGVNTAAYSGFETRRRRHQKSQ